jgi:hypothetical protein
MGAGVHATLSLLHGGFEGLADEALVGDAGLGGGLHGVNTIALSRMPRARTRYGRRTANVAGVQPRARISLARSSQRTIIVAPSACMTVPPPS